MQNGSFMFISNMELIQISFCYQYNNRYFCLRSCFLMIQAQFSVAQSNIPYIVIQAVTALALIIILLIYICKYHPSAPIVAILALLLFNDLFQILFELITFMNQPPFAVCVVGITGSTFFRLATYYWLIFITRLVYQEKATPGKQIDLAMHVSKNLVLTYFPSITVSLLILVVSNLDKTQNKVSCWKIIKEQEFTDYVIYMASFILPTLFALIIIIVYLIAYVCLRPKQHSIFLAYSILAIPFMCYYLAMKICNFIGIDLLSGNQQIPLTFKPITHCIIFIMILRKANIAFDPKLSDLTLGDSNDQLISQEK